MFRSHLRALVQRKSAETSALLLYLFSLVRRSASDPNLAVGQLNELTRDLEALLMALRSVAANGCGVRPPDELQQLCDAIDDLLIRLRRCGLASTAEDFEAALPGLQMGIVNYHQGLPSLRTLAGQGLPISLFGARRKTWNELAACIPEKSAATYGRPLEGFLCEGAYRSILRVANARAKGGVFVPGAWGAEEEALHAPEAQSYIEAPIESSPNLVISLPRSGLNWLRYCVERLTGMRTPGSKRLVGGNSNIAFHRSHRALSKRPYGDRLAAPLYDRSGKAHYERIAIIVRNPIESFVRHAERDVRELIDLVDNLAAFDTFKGPKACLYYEEFLENINPIVELVKFFELPMLSSAPVDAGTVRSWSDESRALYKDRYGNPMGTQSFTASGRFDPLFHSHSVSRDERRRIHNLLKGLNPRIYEQYLARYAAAIGVGHD